MGLSGSIVEVAAWTATVPTPGAGSAVLAADVIAGEQALTNRLKNIATRYAAVSLTLLENHDDALTTVYEVWTGSTSYAFEAGGAAPIQPNITSALVGDVIDLEIDAVMFYDTTVGGGPDIAKFQIVAIDDVSGAVVSTTHVCHAIIDQANALQKNYSLHLGCQHTVLNAGTTRFRIQTRSTNNALNAIRCPSYSARALLLRKNNA